MLPNVFVWKNHTTGIFDKNKGFFRPLQGYSIKGTSDILGVVAPEGRLIAIEVKSDSGLKTFLRLTHDGYRPAGKNLKAWEHAQEQLAFLKAIQKCGGLAGVASSVEDAQKILSGVGLHLDR